MGRDPKRIIQEGEVHTISYSGRAQGRPYNLSALALASVKVLMPGQ